VRGQDCLPLASRAKPIQPGQHALQASSPYLGGPFHRSPLSALTPAEGKRSPYAHIPRMKLPIPFENCAARHGQLLLSIATECPKLETYRKGDRSHVTWFTRRHI
jgi:hypothetical protein